MRELIGGPGPPNPNIGGATGPPGPPISFSYDSNYSMDINYDEVIARFYALHPRRVSMEDLLKTEFFCHMKYYQMFTRMQLIMQEISKFSWGTMPPDPPRLGVNPPWMS